MKKTIILSLILASIGMVNAESLFSLNASQNAMIEPKALFSSVRARAIGDLVSIVIDEAPQMTDIGSYSTEKSSSLAENFTNAINTIFKTSLKGALDGTNGVLNVSGETQTNDIPENAYPDTESASQIPENSIDILNQLDEQNEI